MNNPPTAEPVRIPIGRNVTYAVRGMPEVANAYGPGYLVPTEISLTYRAAEDSQLGRFHAYVKGHWRRDGEVVSSGEKLPGQHYYGDPSTWPAWLAEEARLHDPERAASAPAVWIDGHPQLEAIAAAVWERCRTEDTSTVVDDPRNIAVAALAAISAAVDSSEDRCAECSHPRGAHEEAEEPVSVGRCTDCADQDDEDAEWHDFEWGGGLRRLAEPQTALKRAHVALAEQAGHDQAALARVERLALTFEVSGNEFIAEQIRAVVSAVPPQPEEKRRG